MKINVVQKSDKPRKSSQFVTGIWDECVRRFLDVTTINMKPVTIAY
jgi:hypothetical protein